MNGFERRRGRGKQWGAVAVEFAFVFPLMFMLTYGVVVYGYTFVLQQSLNFAAQEAAEAAVAVDPRADAADSLRNQRVRDTATAILNWMPAGQKERVIGVSGEQVEIEYCTGGSGGQCPNGTDAIIVTLNFSMTTPAYLFPVLDMPLVGQIPPLPEQLTAKAVARI